MTTKDQLVKKCWCDYYINDIFTMLP